MVASRGGTQLGQEKGRNFESVPEPEKKLTNYSGKKLGQLRKENTRKARTSVDNDMDIWII